MLVFTTFIYGLSLFIELKVSEIGNPLFCRAIISAQICILLIFTSMTLHLAQTDISFVPPYFLIVHSAHSPNRKRLEESLSSPGPLEGLCGPPLVIPLRDKWLRPASLLHTLLHRRFTIYLLLQGSFPIHNFY